MNKVELTLPLKPHLHNFVRSELKDVEGVIDVTAYGALGGWLMGVVKSSDRPQPDYGAHCLTFLFPLRDLNTANYDAQTCFLVISQQNINRFNHMVEYLLCLRLFSKLELLEEMGHTNRRNGLMKQTIILFIEKYNSPAQEMNYDMLRMRYQRWKKKQETLLQQVI